MRCALPLSVLLVLLAGCSAADAGADTSSPASPAPRGGLFDTSINVEDGELPDRDDNLFLSLIRPDAPRLSDVSDARLVEMSRGSCARIDGGEGFRDLLDEAVASGLERGDAVTVFAGAVAVHCREHRDALQELDD